jgi:hypothetical protein
MSFSISFGSVRFRGGTWRKIRAYGALGERVPRALSGAAFTQGLLLDAPSA